MGAAPDPEQLLRQDRFLKALARTLVVDPNRADDLVQQTWLVALTHETRGSIFAWLATVVRRFAFRARREEARRAKREQAAALAEEGPSDAMIRGREDTRRAVFEAVLRLDEPYKTTIVLRFLEDLPPREIAARLRVPVATVRIRIQRGLAMLRGRLAAEDPKLDRLVLFALGARSTTTVSQALLMTLMKTKLTVALTAACLVAAFGLWHFLRDYEANAEPSTPGVALSTAPILPPRPDLGSASRTAVATSQTCDPIGGADPFRLTGRVMTKTGAALPGARVALVLREMDDSDVLDPGIRYCSGTAVTSATSDMAGEFAFAVERAVAYRVVAEAPGFATKVLAACKGAQRLVVVMEPGATLEGTITARGGNAVPAALVRLYSANQRLSASTDELGRFRLAGISPDRWGVGVSAAGHKKAPSRVLEFESASTHRLDVELEAPEVVVGTITDAVTGTPIAGATVAEDASYEGATLSESTGRYRLECRTREIRTRLYARAPGYGEGTNPVGLTGKESVADFRLAPAAGVTGRVVDEAGKPLEGVYLAAVGSLGYGDVHLNDWLPVRTGNDGRFRIDGLDRKLVDAGGQLVSQGRWYVLYLRAHGRGTRVLDLPQAIACGQTFEAGDLVLHAGAKLEGRVTDRAGKAVAGTRVELWFMDAGHRALCGDEPDRRDVPKGRPRTWARHTSQRRFMTREDGTFGFADVAAGEHLLVAWPAVGVTFDNSEQQVTVADGEQRTDLRLVVDLGQEQAARIVTPGGRSVTGASFSATATSVGGPSRSSARTDAEGRLVFVGIRPGKYDLHFSDGPEGWYVCPVLGAELPCADLQIVATPATTITGTVLDANGEPAAGAQVTGMATGTHPPWWRNHPTGLDGKFSMKVPEGASWTVRANLTGSSSGPEVVQDNVSTGTQGLVLRAPSRR